MADKPKPEGVALSIDDTPDRYAEDGVPVSTPEDASAVESKSGHQAASKKEQ